KKNETSIFTDSLYEYAYLLTLEQDPIVKKFHRCSDLIPYVRLNGKKARYIPDFRVELFSGRIFVQEIKPSGRLEEPLVKQKAAAALRFYAGTGITFQFITEQDIGVRGFRRVPVNNLHPKIRKRVLPALAGAITYTKRKALEL